LPFTGLAKGMIKGKEFFYPYLINMATVKAWLIPRVMKMTNYLLIYHQ